MRILLILTLFIIALTSTISFAQTIAPESVPVAVKNKFNEKFPGAVMPQWKQEAPGFVEVSFTYEKKKHNATFAGFGDWVSTTQFIKPEELPAGITEYIAKEFLKGKINSAGITETKTSKTYDIVVKQSGQSFDVVFDMEGNLKHKEKIE